MESEPQDRTERCVAAGRKRRLLRGTLCLAAFAGLIGVCFLPPVERFKYWVWGEYALHVPLKGFLKKTEVNSPALGGARECWLYLPPGYDAEPTRRYPVVVLLHGAPGAPEDWIFKGAAAQTTDRLTTEGKLPPLLLVVPDGRGIGRRESSLYVDAIGNPPGGAMETFIARELPAWLLSRYRADPDPRQWAICGLSEGGFGAANMVCRHPERYHLAMPISAMFAPELHAPETVQILGKDPARYADYSPMQTVARLKPPPDFFFALAVGADDRYGDTETQHFADRLKELGIPYTLNTPRGGHNWLFWSRAFADDLALLGKRLFAQSAKENSP